MKSFLTLLKCAGVLLLGFAVVFLVNLPHDAVINRLCPGAAWGTVPRTAPAEVLSSGIAFLAGAAAGFLVSLAGGRHRRVLLVVLTGLFLLTDLAAVLGPIAATSVGYRLAVVALVPLEVWVGHKLAQLVRVRRLAPSPALPTGQVA